MYYVNESSTITDPLLLFGELHKNGAMFVAEKAFAICVFLRRSAIFARAGITVIVGMPGLAMPTTSRRLAANGHTCVCNGVGSFD